MLFRTITEAKENAELVIGLREGMTREELEQSVAEGNIEADLKRIPVQKGDMIYIPAGTVHAILGGIKLIEVQQSSDVTYR